MPVLLCLLIALVIIWQLIDGVMTIYALHHQPLPKVQQDQSQTAVKPKMSSQIANLPLFGDYVPQNIDDSAIRKSSLNLKVVGVIYAESEEDSQAMIRSSKGEEKMYRIDDILPGGAIIKRITPFGVVINQGGRLESLSLPKDELIFSPPPQPLSEE